MTLWSRAWSLNYAALELLQHTGLTRFSPVKPQQWVAAFEHHTSPHGLPQPHIHNIVIASSTTPSAPTAIRLPTCPRGSADVTVILGWAYRPTGGLRIVQLILSVAGPGPADISSAWDAFFHDWVKPVVHFGTPVLIVFAVLLTLTRVLTGVLVTKDSPGIRSAKTSARLPVSAMYWFGVICLLYSAIEATIVFPLARDVLLGKHQPQSAPPAPWTAEFSIGMTAAAAVVVWVLYCIVGRPLRRKVYVPGLKKRERRDLGLGSYARIGWTIPITVGTALAAGALIAGVIGLWWHYPRLDCRAMPGAYAPLLAVFGVVIVGRTRGIGMGLVLQGHDKTGGDDAGLSASVRARLYTLACHGPAGIQVTQQTDVGTLPQEALSLIPEGTLTKLAALFISLFTPATPWRANVTEQSDGSIVISILRNGVAVDAAVIRESTLLLPDVGAGNEDTGSSADDTQSAGGDSPGGSGPASSGGAADWTVELRIAAAAFILLTLSERYYHLRAGLSGAREWRSVAMQVIATDRACRLSVDGRRALLTNAVAEDDGNMAAQLALLNICYRTTADQDANRLFAERISKLLEKVPNEEGMWPLRLRLRFNLLAAKLNEAASFKRREDRRCSASPDIDKEAAEVRDVLECAARQAEHLVVFWQDPENQKAFPNLWQDMDTAVTTAAEAVRVEWKRRFSDPMKVRWEESSGGGNRKQAKMTLETRYERACTLIGCAAISAGRRQSCLYTQALDELEMVAAVREFRTWARTDPSLAELHDLEKITNIFRRAAADGKPEVADVLVVRAAMRALAAECASGPLVSAFHVVDRFKNLIGDPCPPDFLALPPFTRCREEIEKRGIHSAAELGVKAATVLVSELQGITDGIAARWLEVAGLYTWLREVPPACMAKDPAKRDEITTALAFLLIKAKLGSVPALQHELGNGLDQFRERLLVCARPWAVVVPCKQEISCWQQELNCGPGSHKKVYPVRSNTTDSTVLGYLRTALRRSVSRF